MGLNESGKAEIKNGDLWINGQQVRALSDLRVGGQAGSSSGNSTGKLFNMPVGKVMFMNMRLCSEAMLCKNVTAGCIVITNSRSITGVSTSGQALSQDISVTSKRKKRALGNINILTPSGMHLIKKAFNFTRDLQIA